MVCLLNEEIRAIQCSIAHLRKGIALESNQAKKIKMQNNVKELEKVLDAKLGEDTNYVY